MKFSIEKIYSCEYIYILKSVQTNAQYVVFNNFIVFKSKYNYANTGINNLVV